MNTRLIPDIGVKAATKLQYDLLLDRLQVLHELDVCQVWLMCAPDTQHEVFQMCKQRYQLELSMQSGEDLGERMANGVRHALKTFDACIIVGTDAPALTGQDIIQAIETLHEDASVVFVPAEDGGYVLLGMNERHDFLFENISWGSEQVMQQSRQAAIDKGVSLSELAERWDIDSLADYQRYMALIGHRV